MTRSLKAGHLMATALAFSLASVVAVAPITAGGAEAKKDGAPKKGFLGGIRAPALLKGPKPKLPDVQLIKRFEDPAYPQVSVTPAPGTSVGPGVISGLMGGEPVEVQWVATRALQTGLLDPIIAKGPRPTVKARLRVYSNSLVAAHALSDGTIWVSTGLLAYVSEKAEKDQGRAEQLLIYIISHEYGHVLMRHPQALSKSEASYKMLKDSISTAGTLYMFAKAVTQDQKASYSEQQREAQKAMGVMVGAQLAGVLMETEIKRAIYPEFRKETERDADMLAADLVMRLPPLPGKAPPDPIYGMESLDYLKDHNKLEIARAAERAKLARKTVADTAKMVVALAPFALAAKDSDSFLREVAWLAALNIGALVVRKYDERRRLEGVAIYDSAEERQDLVFLYYERFHISTRAAAKSSPSEPASETPLPTTGRVNWKEIGDSVKGGEARDEAIAKLAAGDVSGARAAINRALASPIKESVEVQDTAARVAASENKHDLAIVHLRKVLVHRPRDETLYLDIAQRYLAKPDRPNALKVLADGAKAVGTSAPFLPTRITIYRLDNNQPEIDKALVECRATKDWNLIRICEDKAKPPEVEKGLSEGAEGEDGETEKGGLDFFGEARKALGGLPGLPALPAKPAPATVPPPPASKPKPPAPAAGTAPKKKGT